MLFTFLMPYKMRNQKWVLIYFNLLAAITGEVDLGMHLVVLVQMEVVILEIATKCFVNYFKARNSAGAFGC